MGHATYFRRMFEARISDLQRKNSRLRAERDELRKRVAELEASASTAAASSLVQQYPVLAHQPTP